MSIADHQGHRLRLEEILFDTADGTAPEWLRRRFQDCRSHYDGVKTTPEFQGALRAFETSQDRPFELFVVGEGNFGKSTLLNALLGEQASKIDTLPATRCFLRYVLSNDPADYARMFARIEGEGHDWLRPLLGEGKEVSEPYGTHEYSVPLSTAELVLSGEAERCSRPGSTYNPAVVEIERKLPWTDRRLFQPGIRFVDTQGLDQQLPEDLIRMAQVQSGVTTMERFKQWIDHTPRGRHLDWQYRRCDAVLWCVNAKRIGSAVTGASLRYFRKYGKKTVIALTNVDRVRDGLQVILNKAEHVYADAADCIVPISGKAALEASLRGDIALIAESGLRRLVDTLTGLCITNGARVRVVSQYVSLRTTEAQLRLALQTFLGEIKGTLEHLQDSRSSINITMRQAIEQIERKLDASGKRQIDFIRSNLAGLELTDDGYAARVRMKPDDARTRHETEALQACRGAMETAEAVCRELRRLPFRLPIFDADGKRAGDSVSVQTDIEVPLFQFERPAFHIDLEGTFWKGLQLWWGEKIKGFFSEAARQKAAAERRQLERERREDAARQFETAWIKHQGTVRAECQRGISAVFNEMLEAVNAVERSLEQIEGEPLSTTRDRLISVLGHVCNPPAIAGTIVERIRTVISSAQSHRRINSPSAGRPLPFRGALR